MKKVITIVLSLCIFGCITLSAKVKYKTDNLPSFKRMGCYVYGTEDFYSEDILVELNELTCNSNMDSLVKIAFDVDNTDNRDSIAEICREHELEVFLLIHPRINFNKAPYLTSNVEMKLYDASGNMLCFVHKDKKGSEYPAIGYNNIFDSIMFPKICYAYNKTTQDGIIAAWNEMAKITGWNTSR